MVFRRLIILFFLSVAVFLNGCSINKKPDPLDNVKPLNIGIMEPVDTLNPIMSNSISSMNVIDAITRGLIDWNDKWDMIPSVAKRVPTVENGGIKKQGKYGVKLVLDIDGRARWSNGAFVEAGDFLFFYQMAVYPGIPHFDDEWTKIISKVGSTGENSIEIFLESTDFRVLDYLKPIPRTAIEAEVFKSPKRFFTEPVKFQSIVNGPYMVKDAEIKKEKVMSLLLERNQEYSKKKPKIERIQFRSFSTTEAFESDLFSGNFDVLPYLSMSQGISLAKNNDYNVFFTHSSEVMTLFLDMRSMFLRDLKVRKALIKCIDRLDLVRRIYGDMSRISESFLAEKHYAYKPFFSSLKFSPEESEKLIKQAGWNKDSGKELKKGNNTFVLHIFYAKNKENEEIANFVKESWQKLGISVVLDGVPMDIFFSSLSEKLTDIDYPDIVIWPLNASPWIDPSQYFSSKGILTQKNKGVGLNFSRWKNPKSDKLCEKLSGDPEEDIIVLQDLEKLVSEQIPVIPLFSGIEVSACRRSISNFSPRGFGSNLWNVEYWEKEDLTPGSRQ